MLIDPFMAGITVERCAFILIIEMAFCTGDRSVFAGQNESSQVVIKNSRFPSGGVVTSGTIWPKTAIMNVPGSMTGIAVCRRALEHLIFMTAVTSQVDVFAFQFKGG
jgi:hypothetical protein